VNDEEFKNYALGLEPGDRVIETSQTSCMRGKKGVVYLSTNPGHEGSVCVLWDGGMGTSITHGTRLLCVRCESHPQQDNPAVRFGYCDACFEEFEQEELPAKFC